MTKAIDYGSIEKLSSGLGACCLDIRNVKGSEQSLDLIKFQCHWNGKSVSFCLYGSLPWSAGQLPGANSVCQIFILLLVVVQSLSHVRLQPHGLQHTRLPCPVA